MQPKSGSHFSESIALESRNGGSKYSGIIILGDIPGTAFMKYPEILEEYMPWHPVIQKRCR